MLLSVDEVQFIFMLYIFVIQPICIVHYRAKPVSALLMAKEEDVAIRLSERVAKLVVPPGDEEITCTPQMAASCIQSEKVHPDQNMFNDLIIPLAKQTKFYVNI